MKIVPAAVNVGGKDSPKESLEGQTGGAKKWTHG